MTTSILSELGIEIHDNFCRNFEDIRKEANAALYRNYRIVSNTYRGICVRAGRSALEKEFLGKFMVKFEYFRRYEEGMKQETFIHSDAAISEYTAVLSLRDDNGAICFWRHKASGLFFPDNKDSESLQSIMRDGEDESNWDLIDKIDLPANRCVIYPANLFHSRYPKEWIERDARIVLVLFMNKSRII